MDKVTYIRGEGGLRLSFIFYKKGEDYAIDTNAR